MMEISIRPATRQDVGAIKDLYNVFIRDTVITFDVDPWTLEARLEWFEQFSQTGPYRLLVGELDGQFAGYIGSMRFRVKKAYRTSVETTIYIQPDFQGRGVGARLYDALFEILRGENVHRAYAGITVPNEPSVKLHETAGFSLAGTFSEVGFKGGRYHDVAWYEKAVDVM